LDTRTDRERAEAAAGRSGTLAALLALWLCAGSVPLLAQGAPSAPPADAPAELPDSGRVAVGVAVATPGYANLTARYSLRRMALRLSGGVGGGGRSGVQADVAWMPVRAHDLAMGVALVGGTFTARESAIVGVNAAQELHRQLYLGGAFDMILDGFHLQLGLAHGFRDYPPDAQLIVQLGYEIHLR
jgi:hypothetical protein